MKIGVLNVLEMVIPFHLILNGNWLLGPFEIRAINAYNTSEAALNKAEEAISVVDNIAHQLPEDQKKLDELAQNITETNQEIEDAQENGWYL